MADEDDFPTVSSKEDLLETIKALDRELVTIPSWKRKVWVRAVTEDERHRMGLIGTKEPDRNIMATWASLVVVDEEGERYFSDKEAAGLAKSSAAAIQTIVEVSRRLSGLTKESRAALGKASAATSDAASSTA